MCTIVRSAAALPFASLTIEAPWTTLSGIAVAIVPAGVALARRRRSASIGDVPGSPDVAPVPAVEPAAVPAVMPRVAGAHRRRGIVGERLAFVILAIAVGGVGLAAAHRTDGTTRITVLDVGQGDSILVEGGRGGRMLVDGGPNPDRLLVELDRRLPPWDRRIDVLILTHPHEDHVAGLALLLERYRVGRVYDTGMRGPGPGYAAFARGLSRTAGPLIGTLSTGARISLDDVRLRVLWPDPGRVPREPPDAGRGINDVSIVLLGEIAGRRFLLTGDVEDDVDPLLAQRGLPPVDILKVAHHGSATASTPAFLDAVRPRVAIVSAGAGNPYGHPARSTIDRLVGTGARVLRSDRDGSVSVTIGPDGSIAVATTGARRVGAVAAPEIGLAPIPGPEVRVATGTAFAGPPRPVPPAIAFTCAIPSGE
ncbi:MAG: hypothetical protein NVS9B8_05250 [Candidatus Limnocylindrales bacterium]